MMLWMLPVSNTSSQGKHRSQDDIYAKVIHILISLNCRIHIQLYSVCPNRREGANKFNIF